MRDKENLDKQKRQKTRNSKQKGAAQKQGSLPRRFTTNMAEAEQKGQDEVRRESGARRRRREARGTGLLWFLCRSGL